jgi:hypothetical protein
VIRECAQLLADPLVLERCLDHDPGTLERRDQKLAIPRTRQHDHATVLSGMRQKLFQYLEGPGPTIGDAKIVERV